MAGILSFPGCPRGSSAHHWLCLGCGYNAEHDFQVYKTYQGEERKKSKTYSAFLMCWSPHWPLQSHPRLGPWGCVVETSKEAGDEELLSLVTTSNIGRTDKVGRKSSLTAGSKTRFHGRNWWTQSSMEHIVLFSLASPLLITAGTEDYCPHSACSPLLFLNHHTISSPH